MSTLPVSIDSELLSKSSWESLGALATELSRAYATRQIFRTETEARVSVLDDLHHPTSAAKYWQAVREQTVMLEQLAGLSYEYRRNEVQIKRKTLRLAETTDPLDREDIEIDLDECMYRRAGMKAVAEDRAREIRMWSKLKRELDDGSFDAQNVDTHQLVSYTIQFAHRAAHADRAQMSIGELDNLTGLLQTSLRRCKELGLLDQILPALPPSVAKELDLV